MNLNELRILQNYPLEMKIERTKQRIREWVDYYGENGTYISFSGGKDSTVLLDIVRSIYPNIEAVFINTGLEYPEIYKFVKTFKNVTILKPEMNFKQVINTYGYPVISKENSQYIYEIRHSTKKMRQRRLYGDSKGRFKLPNKYHYLIDAPFEISNKCCEVMKKRPVKKFEKETGKVPIIGTMAEESSLRQQSYLQHGCNAFESKRPVSTPLGFWKQQDVLEYIYKNDLKIASVYGEVIEDKNLLDECTYSTTGCERTGCIYCLYGIQCDTTPNRIQRLKKTHKKQYDYCINKLKLGEVLDYIGVKY
ncbi:phosphoadenosine phosphosulfate reductase family protein [Intestinibacter bartlettii]|uniref:phosphoadenosine phosphosulfate reductase family protein n=1 Tax=Intestinibacter bartlettii TaxID=261299 RepID=UPI0039966814